MKSKRKLILSPEERERRRVRGEELAELRKKRKEDVVTPGEVAPIEKREEIKNKVLFHCNLANTQIAGIQFHNHFYETENEEEIELLKNYGAQQGCIVREVKAS